MSRILLIDDDKDLLTVLKNLLQKKGFDIDTRDSWEEGSGILKYFKPNLVILDVFLKDLDGLEICKKIKHSPFWKNIPVLMVSGYPRVAETAVYEYGADDFIAKPFEVSDLLRKIHKIFLRKHESV
jgi:DNA-binding response OmpR family regulator